MLPLGAPAIHEYRELEFGIGAGITGGAQALCASQLNCFTCASSRQLGCTCRRCTELLVMDGSEVASNDDLLTRLEVRDTHAKSRRHAEAV